MVCKRVTRRPNPKVNQAGAERVRPGAVMPSFFLPMLCGTPAVAHEKALYLDTDEKRRSMSRSDASVKRFVAM